MAEPTHPPPPPQDNPLAHHLSHFLTTRHPPKTFCPSEVARALSSSELQTLGFAGWREAMPAVRELAWEWRARGEGVEILQKGVVLGLEVGVGDVRGPIRVRRVEG
ncbi:hypothetical protein LTR48_001152 [Friedmanniomyces endolithicus]|uniref:Uncharacterized protein n=1 Tax=Rachicladosporium monterosium TaxID=1507873 RepID=A0ABR0LF31_9PEZI|nr:hypothetical protein LTR48_001152 [Friedmanniomyces endolithicus]KAK5147807.1 hypothetical protein LTR32_000781 [Rachicladosporium monterosium]